MNYAITLSTCVLVFATATKWGAAPERLCAAALLSMFGLDRLYHLIAGPAVALGHTDLWHFVMDLAVCAILVAVGCYANRIYPLWLAALQIVAVNAHLVRSLHDSLAPFAYATLFIAPLYFQIPILAAGIAFHRNRELQFGRYRAWRGVASVSQGQTHGF